jgi:hypothetical protein
MNNLRKLILFFAIVLFSSTLKAQLTGFSGGLAFSSGVDYNTGTTGNPGLFGKAYLKVTKRFHVVPGFVVYNKFKRTNFQEVLKTYMFQGDLDAVIGIYKDRSLRFVGFTGLNGTAMLSKWDILIDLPSNENYKNLSDIKPGINLGGAAQLYINDSMDAYISAKYIISSFDQLVINAGVIYYFTGQHRRNKW